MESVENKINWESENSSKVPSILMYKITLQIRKEILTIQGHKLEEMCKETWPQLKSVRNNNNGDSALKKDIIDNVINDFPDFVSQDLVDTLNQLE